MINQETSPDAKTTQTPRLPSRPGPRLAIGNYRKELGIFILLLILCAVVAALNHSFYGADNLQDLARLIGIYGIFSIGAGIVIITGGIELSVGSVFALEGVLLAMMLMQWHWVPALAILASLALTIGLGLLHGELITRIPLQPFIVTLCGLLAYRGLARVVTNDNTEGFGDGTGFHGLMNLASGNFLGIPAPFVVLIAISIIMWIVLHRSLYGRYLYAVGRNEEASRYSGINSQRIITSAYVVAGVLTGIAGILLAFYTNSISPAEHGQSYELYGIAAAVLGGCSLRGGEGSIIGILIGTILLQVLRNAVNLVNVFGHSIPSSFEYVVVGVVILLGVIVDEVVKRRSAKKIKA
jgi:ribose transport system permease protein